MEHTEHIMTSNERLSLQQMDRHVRSKAVQITEQVPIVCIDDRYDKHLSPSYARPGGCAGYFLVTPPALANLGISLTLEDLDKLFDIVVDEVGGKSNFFYHTTEGAEVENGGCGHVTATSSDPVAYEFSHEWLKAASLKLAKLKHGGAHEDVLQGRHGAKAIAIVEGDMYIPRVGDNGVQIFVYNKKQDEERISRLSATLARQFNIDQRKLLDEMLRISTKQTNQTIAHVGSTLPKFLISGSASNPSVAEIQ